MSEGSEFQPGSGRIVTYCEKCGTRYTVSLSAGAALSERMGRLSAGARVFAASLRSDTAAEQTLAATRQELQRKRARHELEAINRILMRCPRCGLYSCRRCWNGPEGRCVTCAPPKATPVLAPREAERLVAAAAADRHPGASAPVGARARDVSSGAVGEARRRAGAAFSASGAAVATGGRRVATGGRRVATLLSAPAAALARRVRDLTGRGRGLAPATVRRAPALVLLLSLLAAGVVLGGELASNRRPPTQPEFGGAAPTPTGQVAGAAPSATPRGTSTPGAASATPGATVAVGQRVVRAWQTSLGVAHAHVVVEVRNAGSGWVTLRAGDSSYTIRDRSGRALETGYFAYSFPASVGPGQTAYLIETVDLDFVRSSQVSGVDAKVTADAGDALDTRIEVSNVRWRTAPLAEGLEVSGTATNLSRREVTNGVIGVVLFDARGRIVAGVYDPVDLASLAAGEARRFATSYPGTPPTGPRAVARAEAFAFEER